MALPDPTDADPTTGGTPAGMSGSDVEGRADLAGYLGKEIWPADAETLQAKAREANAPDRVQGQLQSLPSDQRFANISEVWQALHGGVEQQRF
jgi:hypothetical protein